LIVDYVDHLALCNQRCRANLQFAVSLCRAEALPYTG
jgi:hypothetical protein